MEVKPEEYCTVSHNGLRLWRNGMEGGVSNEAMISDVEAVVHEGVPVMWYCSEFESMRFEKRWIKMDKSFNFVYVL